MKVPPYINRIRQKVMGKLTSNIGKKYQKKLVKKPENVDIKKVLISRPNNRLGNLLLMTPLVEVVTQKYPDCKVDLITKGGLADVIFEHYDNINTIIKLPRKPFKSLFTYVKIFLSVGFRKYDLVINAEKSSSSGKILTWLANAPYKIFDVPESFDQFPKDFDHIAKNSAYLFKHYFEKPLTKNNTTKIPDLDLKLNQQELEKGKGILNKIVGNNKKTISIFTNATGGKKYSVAWWEEVYGELQHRYPDYNIIEILPIENTSQINFAAPSFYSKDIREMGAVMANTELFITADCGVMHLACASNVPTVGLFSVTSKEKYEPYNQGSFAVDTKNENLKSYFEKIDGILKSDSETSHLQKLDQ